MKRALLGVLAVGLLLGLVWTVGGSSVPDDAVSPARGSQKTVTRFAQEAPSSPEGPEVAPALGEAQEALAKATGMVLVQCPAPGVPLEVTGAGLHYPVIAGGELRALVASEQGSAPLLDRDARSWGVVEWAEGRCTVAPVESQGIVGEVVDSGGHRLTRGDGVEVMGCRGPVQWDAEGRFHTRAFEGEGCFLTAQRQDEMASHTVVAGDRNVRLSLKKTPKMGFDGLLQGMPTFTPRSPDPLPPPEVLDGELSPEARAHIDAWKAEAEARRTEAAEESVRLRDAADTLREEGEL